MGFHTGDKPFLALLPGSTRTSFMGGATNFHIRTVLAKGENGLASTPVLQMSVENPDVPVGSPPRQNNLPKSDKSSNHSVEITRTRDRYPDNPNTPTRNAGQTTSKSEVSSAMKEP